MFERFCLAIDMLMVRVRIILFVSDNFREKFVTVNVTIPTVSGTTPLMSINNWIVIQQRLDSTQTFDNGWSNYKSGFGVISKNFWLGLEKIYQLTSSRHYSLRIEIQSVDHDKWFSAEYNSFFITSETRGYALNVSDYVGDAGDALNNMNNSGKYFQNGMKFSTRDKDNDLATDGNCASQYPGGFWMNRCYYTCLNCRYNTIEFNWYSLPDVGAAASIQLRASRMMIRST